MMTKARILTFQEYRTVPYDEKEENVTKNEVKIWMVEAARLHIEE